MLHIGEAQQMEPGRLRRAFRNIGIVLCVLVLGGLMVYGVIIAPATDSPFNEAPFSRDAWTTSPGNDVSGNLRTPMAADVQKRVVKKGMLRTEVRQLLGTPDESQVGEELAGEDSYSLGHSGQMSFGSDRLIVRYDRAGKVVSSVIAGR
jgi:hypothetical protein